MATTPTTEANAGLSFTNADGVTPLGWLAVMEGLLLTRADRTTTRTAADQAAVDELAATIAGIHGDLTCARYYADGVAKQVTL